MYDGTLRNISIILMLHSMLLQFTNVSTEICDNFRSSMVIFVLKLRFASSFNWSNKFIRNSLCAQLIRWRLVMPPISILPNFVNPFTATIILLTSNNRFDTNLGYQIQHPDQMSISRIVACFWYCGFRIDFCIQLLHAQQKEFMWNELKQQN